MYATPNQLMGNNVFCTSLAGEELGRMRSWGSDPYTQARHKIASPTTMVDLPQNLLEPILFGAACARGTRARLSTEYLVAGAGRRRRHRDGARPRLGRGVSDPREVPDRRRRRELQGRRGHRAADGRQDGGRRLDQHHHQGRPHQVRRAPAERPLLGAAAGLQRRRYRHGPRAHDPARGTSGC